MASLRAESNESGIADAAPVLASRRTALRRSSTPRLLRPSIEPTATPEPQAKSESTPPPAEESAVHLIAPQYEVASPTASPTLEQVTLVIYGWKSVQPGTIHWVFPSLGAALSAVRAMRNAIGWAIIAGRRDEAAVSVEAERARGTVLVEQAAE